MKNMKLATKISVIVICILTVGLVILWSTTNGNVSSLMERQILENMNEAAKSPPNMYRLQNPILSAMRNRWSLEMLYCIRMTQILSQGHKIIPKVMAPSTKTWKMFIWLIILPPFWYRLWKVPSVKPSGKGMH